MGQLSQRFIEKLEQAETLEDLQHRSEELRDAYAIDHIVYHWVSSKGEQYGCGTYDPAWAQLYIDRDYLRVDPVIIGCYARFHPVDWKRLDWSSKGARDFFKEARRHGVGNQGFSIPIRGPIGQFALFTVNHSCDDAAWAAFCDQHRRELILVAHLFNQKALEFEGIAEKGPTKGLSPREVDAMTLLAVGYSRAQVADSLAISEHTLRVYIESARFKLGAMNTTHAVARAMQQGYIVV
ncbi:MAG: autoinducer binding domain-containing protein [Pseudomonadota bacterium]